MRKSTIIISVLEAIVILVIKLIDWKESRQHKPAAGRVRSIKGKPVVRSEESEYYKTTPDGDENAADLLAGPSAADEKIQKNTRK
jgi:hypothetical protein